MSEQAVGLLQELGYTSVRAYRGGLADWIEKGGPVEALESVVQSSPQSQPAETVSTSAPPLMASPDGTIGRGPARVSAEVGWDRSFLSLIERRSTLQLLLIWVVMILSCGMGYWLLALFGKPVLFQAGSPIERSLNGLADAIYFSFVTATSVGYGDILPVGAARVIAVGEAVAALLIFGAIVAKFVSYRQEQLIGEIHRVTFEERLDRVQTNLHTLIAELLTISTICEESKVSPAHISTRLESAVLIFVGELRTTHDLLYRPRLMVEERVLAAILSNLTSALTVLGEALKCLPPSFPRSDTLESALKGIAGLSAEICGNCVPHVYTPRLVFWMDRIQATARNIK